MTPFTHHIIGLVDNFDYSSKAKEWWINLTVPYPNSLPTVTSYSGENAITKWYAYVHQKYVFAPDSSRVLPGNVSFCIHGGDMLLVKPGESCACFASSSVKGYFSVHNFQTIQQWKENVTCPPPLPWNERITKPVWRGIAWNPGHLGEEATLRIANGTSTYLDEYTAQPSLPPEENCPCFIFSRPSRFT